MNRSKIAGIVLLLVLGPPARAQFFEPGSVGSGAPQNIEGFTVAGKGHVAARPDKFEIELSVSAASELTADAVVKYRDAKRRIHEAFTALKLANVVVDERGLLVDQKGMMQSPYFFDYQPNSRTKTEVQLTRKLVVKAADIRKMDEEAVLQLVGRLLDVAQDAGAKVGSQGDFPPYYYYRYDIIPPSGLVHFVLDDFDKLQEEAYEKAIADARARAERLARLSRVELGPIVAVRELVVPGEGRASANADSQDDAPRKRLVTPRFQEIPVRVELLVRFAVHSRSDGKGRANQP
ncbi:MAG: SIMPL domain-containing protein [Isosphaeraceae bacterium]